jgi:hypothetical protein
MSSPTPIFGMCMTLSCLSYCYSFNPSPSNSHVCQHCFCKDFNHLVDGYTYNNSFIPTHNYFQHQYLHHLPTNPALAHTDTSPETERVYSLSSTKPNSMSGFNGSGSSSVSTPYIGESLGKIHNSSASTMYKAYPNVARNIIYIYIFMYHKSCKCSVMNIYVA